MEMRESIIILAKCGVIFTSYSIDDTIKCVVQFLLHSMIYMYMYMYKYWATKDCAAHMLTFDI